MNKERIMLILIQLVVAGVGGWLISDIKVIGGVLLLMWSNNFNFVSKDNIEDSD